MDKFEEAICGHNPLYKEGLQDKYYQGAKWAWQSRQAELEEKDKRIAACLKAIEEHFTCVQNLAHDFVTPEISSTYRTATVMKEIVDETLRGNNANS